MPSIARTSDADRRTSRRVAVQRPCKIKDSATGRYIGATTIDLSQHGIMVQIAQPTNLKPGDDVLIAVAMHERQGIIQAKEMIESQVVRRLELADGGTTLAVQFVAALKRVDTQQAARKAA